MWHALCAYVRHSPTGPALRPGCSPCAGGGCHSVTITCAVPGRMHSTSDGGSSRVAASWAGWPDSAAAAFVVELPSLHSSSIPSSISPPGSMTSTTCFGDGGHGPSSSPRGRRPPEGVARRCCHASTARAARAAARCAWRCRMRRVARRCEEWGAAGVSEGDDSALMHLGLVVPRTSCAHGTGRCGTTHQVVDSQQVRRDHEPHSCPDEGGS